MAKRCSMCEERLKALAISGVSADTFRYYEKIGLVPIVERIRMMRLKTVNDDSKLLKKEKE